MGNIKKWWQWFVAEMKRYNLSEMMQKEEDFIDKYDKIAVEKLSEKGWEVLSTDTRILFFGYKIWYKDTCFIQNVTLREALKMVGINYGNNMYENTQNN